MGKGKDLEFPEGRGGGKGRQRSPGVPPRFRIPRRAGRGQGSEVAKQPQPDCASRNGEPGVPPKESKLHKQVHSFHQ
jgi:hypothetical protein